MIRLIFALFPELEDQLIKFKQLSIFIRGILLFLLVLMLLLAYFIIKGIKDISPLYLSIIVFISSVSIAICLTRLFYKNYPVRWYINRETSNNSMLRDMQKYSILVFLGISNKDLKVYLQNALGFKNSNPTLHSIDVYFSCFEDGVWWEKENFIRNMIESRQNIACELINDLWYQRIPNFKKLNFYQCRHHIAYTGSMMGNRSNGAINWRTIYVVNYLPWSQPDTKTSITFKVDYNIPRKLNKKLIERYCASYQYIHKEAEKLGTFSPSLWDISVSEWASFCQKCNAHQESMKFLLEFAQLTGHEKVLDLAAGTGHMSKVILDHMPHVKLTVLDASPKMLESCKRILGERARYALCKVPTVLREERLIDLETERNVGEKYDAILIHLAIPAVAKCIDELIKLANWCKNSLVDGGKVILCAHNTAVKIISSKFDVSKDPLRLNIKDVVHRMNFKGDYLRPSEELEEFEKCFDQDNIEKTFKDVGYQVDKIEEKIFTMTMEDRYAMWRTPAVMDEILNIDQMLCDYRDTFRNDAWIDKILDVVEHKLKNKPTPDMQVIYWSFKYRNN